MRKLTTTLHWVWATCAWALHLDHRHKGIVGLTCAPTKMVNIQRRLEADEVQLGYQVETTTNTHWDMQLQIY